MARARTDTKGWNLTGFDDNQKIRRSGLKRRDLFAGSLAFGTLGARGMWNSVPAAAAALQRTAVGGTVPRLVPMRAHADQITDIKVCLRPFRPAGPRLDVERVGDKVVIHNYGHGGSGWSLSWGSADIAVGKAASLSPRRIAVVGCGVIGLTSALSAQRAGFDVTIYTRDMLPHTRSVRANGSWTPDSRIALTAPAGPQFAEVWEQMARYSWKTYRDYLGLPGNPIDFRDNYTLSDTPFEEGPEPEGRTGPGDYASTGMPRATSEFATYGDRIRDIIPAPELLASQDNPFPVAYAQRAPMMMFNFGAYGHLLLSEFYQAGGKVVIREFHTPADMKSIAEPVIINCPGYAARDLWGDRTLIPVRGQTTWLPPQPDVMYGVEYKGAAALSKSDGLMIQAVDLNNVGEMEGVGNSFEHADRAESEKAIAVFENLFARFPAGRG